MHLPTSVPPVRCLTLSSCVRISELSPILAITPLPHQGRPPFPRSCLTLSSCARISGLSLVLRIMPV